MGTRGSPPRHPGWRPQQLAAGDQRAEVLNAADCRRRGATCCPRPRRPAAARGRATDFFGCGSWQRQLALLQAACGTAMWGLFATV